MSIIQDRLFDADYPVAPGCARRWALLRPFARREGESEYTHIKVISTTRAPDATAAEAAIHLSSVRKSFGPVRAVDGIDLQVREGEIAALLGPNGAGKTTTIDMILGLS